jgi:ABC-type nickel/cobalt efflux system permease component RcnA
VSALFQSRDLTPIVVLASLVVAFGLGALHALSPGHGKTVMAAYLVGTRGSTRHAVGLGLAVTVSHTIGVLVLGLISLSFAAVIPVERLYPILGVASGTIVIAIGSWLIVQRVLDVRRTRRIAAEHERQHAVGLEHEHVHEHLHAEHEHVERDAAAGWHSHGGIRHTHLPSSSKQLSWRGLVALGLAGGMVPSVSALILLLGSFSLGRPAFGVVLTVAFGLGMAVVLVGVGVALVRASSLVERFAGVRVGASVGRWLPAATAVVVVTAGALMTVQALTLVS